MTSRLASVAAGLLIGIVYDPALAQDVSTPPKAEARARAEGLRLVDACPATETAVIAMLTGAEHPGAYAAAVFDLLDKRQHWEYQAPAPALGVDLEAFAGRYSEQPWGAEVAIVPWGEGLAVLSLPTVKPAEELTILKAKGGDLFRRVREDGSEADEIRFERDQSGRVCAFVEFSKRRSRMGTVPPRPSPDS